MVTFWIFKLQSSHQAAGTGEFPTQQVAKNHACASNNTPVDSQSVPSSCPISDAARKGPHNYQVPVGQGSAMPQLKTGNNNNDDQDMMMMMMMHACL